MNSKFTIVINNKKYDVEVYEKENNVYVARIGNREYIIYMPNEYVNALVEKNRVDKLKQLFEDSQQKQTNQPTTSLEHTGTAVNSDIPGRIVKLFVKEGDLVERGQPIAVIESMKMMIEIKSPAKGRIEKILAREKSFIDVGQPIAILSE